MCFSFNQRYFKLFVDEDPVILTYNTIYEHFLSSPSFSLRMAAIKAIAYILFNDIESHDDFSQLQSARRSKKKIFAAVFERHQIKITGGAMEVDDTDDEEVNSIASSLQLFTSLFCVNFNLRKPLILEISKLVLRYNFSEDASLTIFEKILAFLKCDAQSLIDSNSVEYLLTQWIVYGLSLQT